MVGTTISHYKVIEKIGQGGMGEVYRAEDTNLSREIAIKVLPEQFTQDPQRLARFEREAKLLAQLNHPNIAAIYGLEEADGVRFLSMELVPGETLAEKVAKGPVPVKEALEICRQIAEGVEAAHEKGVIHRDLKPANVKVTPEGKVKILDFGLAKAFEDEIPAADISQSPTLTEEMTRAGVILGTAAYMSPEQARGEEVDKRTDIFAFGCVLYELLTGKRAFDGKTVTDTLAKVLEGVPNWKAISSDTPSKILDLLQRCLEKDSDERLPHIAEARIQLKKALKAPASPSDVASAGQPVQQRWGMTMGLVVLAVIVTGLAVWLLIQPSTPEQRLNRFTFTPSLDVRMENTNGNELAISPDGRHFVYRAIGEKGRQLYLRSLDDIVDRPIPGTEGAFRGSFFSPDGESVAFFAAGSLKKVSLMGGSPITLCDTRPPQQWAGSWGSEGTIVFSAGAEGGSGLYRVSSVGGEPELLATPNLDQGESRYAHPHILPDGENVLFSIRSTADVPWQVAVLSLETKEQKTLLANGRQAHYLPTGHLVYELSRTGNLMAAPFDLARLEVTGEPVPIVEGVRQTTGNSVDYAVSEEGTLVYVPGSAVSSTKRTLVWVDREGQETPVSEEEREYTLPRISRDGTNVAFSLYPTGGAVWTLDLESGAFSRLSFEGIPGASPIWSPDGQWIAFQDFTPGRMQILRQRSDRSAPPEAVAPPQPLSQGLTSWSPDGKILLFNWATGPGGDFDVGLVDLEQDSGPEALVSTPARECCGVFSPDGKWVAYVSNESDLDQVFVRPFRGPDVKFLVSGNEAAGEPVWSPDGTELFYRSGIRMMAVSVETEPTFRAGRPEVLFEGVYRGVVSAPPGYQDYDISPDGRFVMVKEEESSTQD